MKKIKITPPIFLFKEYFKNNAYIYLIPIIFLLYKFINVQYQYFFKNGSDLFVLSLSWVLFLLVFVFTIYNPFETFYKAKKSFVALRTINKTKKIGECFLKYLPIFSVFLLLFAVFIIDDKVQALIVFTPLLLIINIFFYFYFKFILKKESIKMDIHEDVDFVSNLDLKEIFGISDKLLIAYQNFNPNDRKKNRIEEGDYIVGVSVTSLFFIYKSKESELNKVIMNFNDVIEVGFLTFNNKSVLKFVSSLNISISLVIVHEDSLTVHSFLLIKNILEAFDNFILGDVPLNVPKRIRKIEATHFENTSTEVEYIKRQIEFTYSPTLLHEISQSVNITNNRKIEI